MPNLLGNERNRYGRIFAPEAVRQAVLEARRERREFQIRAVCICAGFLSGVILAIIALAPMINK